MGTDLHGFGRGSAMSLEANPVAYSPLARPIVSAGPTLARVAFNSAVPVRPARAGSEIAAGGAGGNGEATLAVVTDSTTRGSSDSKAICRWRPR